MNSYKVGQIVYYYSETQSGPIIVPAIITKKIITEEVEGNKIDYEAELLHSETKKEKVNLSQHMEKKGGSLFTTLQELREALIEAATQYIVGITDQAKKRAFVTLKDLVSKKRLPPSVLEDLVTKTAPEIKIPQESSFTQIQEKKLEPEIKSVTPPFQIEQSEDPPKEETIISGKDVQNAQPDKSDIQSIIDAVEEEINAIPDATYTAEPTTHKTSSKTHQEDDGETVGEQASTTDYNQQEILVPGRSPGHSQPTQNFDGNLDAEVEVRIPTSDAINRLNSISPPKRDVVNNVPSQAKLYEAVSTYRTYNPVAYNSRLCGPVSLDFNMPLAPLEFYDTNGKVVRQSDRVSDEEIRRDMIQKDIVESKSVDKIRDYSPPRAIDYRQLQEEAGQHNPWLEIRDNRRRK